MKTASEYRGGRGARPAALFTCAAMLLVLSAGCGTSTYAYKYENRINELQRTSVFAVLTGEPTDDLPVNFRVPTAMDHAYSLNSADPVETRKHILRDHVLPPFLPNPVGFRRMFEGGYTDSSQVKTPYYLYVWMYDAPTPKDGLVTVREALRSILGDSKADWEQVETKTPKGDTLKWKRLRFKSDQEFEVQRSGTLENEHVPGIFELWYYDTPGWDVLLGWRFSESAWENGKAGDAKLQDLPELVAGTLVVPASGTRNMKPVVGDSRTK